MMAKDTSENDFRVAYLGPRASFSNQAASQLFSPDSNSTQLLPYPTISSLFSAILTGSVNRSIIPLENSTNGLVDQTLELLASTSRDGKSAKLQVCGETSVRVKQYLVGRRSDWKDGSPKSASNLNSGDKESRSAISLSHITSLHTHPQVWTQCTAFLSENFGPNVSHHDEDSTSAAAELVAADETGTSAAICSALAAEVFGLDILAARIEGEAENETRFLVLRQGYPADNDFYEKAASLTLDEARRGLIVFRLLQGMNLHEVEKAIGFVGLAKPRVYSKVGDVGEWVYLFLTGEAKQNEKAAELSTNLGNLGCDMWDWGRWSITR